MRRSTKITRIIIIVILFLMVAILGLLALTDPVSPAPGSSPSISSPKPGAQTLEPTPKPTPTPEPTPYYNTPAAGVFSLPSLFGYQRELEVDGSKADSYNRPEPIAFVEGPDYPALPGVLTFRGNNFRDMPSYGTAKVQTKKLTLEWTVSSGSLPKGNSGDGSWTGSGWVGQPLIVQWPESTKKIMNLYDDAKQKKGLVEVILATMDGNVYFLDLETGNPTRDKLKIGMPFKGAGSLDPRGYPLLYLGSGDMYNEDARKTRAMVYSLIDFTRLYEFGKEDDGFALRSWHAYDSSPLVDAGTDTLFYPGENGVLYSMKLNTAYDEAAGEISVAPSNIVKYRYQADRTGKDKYWLGYEDSAVTWGHYLYLSDNAGLLRCIDLNTMDVVWVQDTWDDTNGTPVFELDEENHTAYIYIGTSLHWTAQDGKGDSAFFKIDAVTGETLWHDVRRVSTVSSVSGGIQATAVLGKHSISDLVIIPYARTPSTGSGTLVALDKVTGEERWSFQTENYAWSSPLAIYDGKGNAYIVQADTGGHIYLLDGKTGTLLDSLYMENNNFEASPVAFGDTIVIGSRAEKIYGIKIR